MDHDPRSSRKVSWSWYNNVSVFDLTFISHMQ